MMTSYILTSLSKLKNRLSLILLTLSLSPHNNRYVMLKDSFLKMMKRDALSLFIMCEWMYNYTYNMHIVYKESIKKMYNIRMYYYRLYKKMYYKESLLRIYYKDVYKKMYYKDILYGCIIRIYIKRYI